MFEEFHVKNILVKLYSDVEKIPVKLQHGTCNF